MSGADKSRSPRIVRRQRSSEGIGFSWSALRPAELWTTLRSYLGLGREAAPEPIDSPEALARFIDKRASFVAQTSLYGYLRTRAGMRYPELFDDDPFVASINIAKWHVWLDCLSDLAVYAGSRLAQEAPREMPRVARMLVVLVDEVLAQPGRQPRRGTGLRHTRSACATAWRGPTGWRSARTRPPSPRAPRGWCAGRQSWTN